MNGNSYYITVSFIPCNTDSYYNVIIITTYQTCPKSQFIKALAYDTFWHFMFFENGLESFILKKRFLKLNLGFNPWFLALPNSQMRFLTSKGVAKLALRLSCYCCYILEWSKIYNERIFFNQIWINKSVHQTEHKKLFV